MVESAKPLAETQPGLPQVFGRYLLVQRLSRGGMGEIFMARHGLSGFELDVRGRLDYIRQRRCCTRSQWTLLAKLRSQWS